jgi:hypothetical protein
VTWTRRRTHTAPVPARRRQHSSDGIRC